MSFSCVLLPAGCVGGIDVASAIGSASGSNASAIAAWARVSIASGSRALPLFEPAPFSPEPLLFDGAFGCSFAEAVLRVTRLVEAMPLGGALASRAVRILGGLGGSLDALLLVGSLFVRASDAGGGERGAVAPVSEPASLSCRPAVLPLALPIPGRCQ